jgi:hypothetical protein
MLQWDKFEFPAIGAWRLLGLSHAVSFAATTEVLDTASLLLLIGRQPDGWHMMPWLDWEMEEGSEGW